MTRVAAVAVMALVAWSPACGFRDVPSLERSAATVTEHSGKVVSALPQEVDPAARYLIYLHNRFAETSPSSDSVHPEFGRYELDAIIEALAQGGLTVIAERRGPTSDVGSWAERVADQVHRLLLAGVSPEHITVVGFSKGGVIAVLASSEIAHDRVSFVFIGACGPWIDSFPDLEPHGRMLSIRESTDSSAGSCRLLFDRSSDGSDYREIVLQIGGGHGAFFRPDSRWTEPVIEWSLGDQGRAAH